MLLNDEEMESAVQGEWNAEHLRVAKAQLKKVVEWAVEERQKLKEKKINQRIVKPEDRASQIIFDAKARAFQQVIDKCGQNEY